MEPLGLIPEEKINMGRSPCCDDDYNLKKGPWTSEEDNKLIQYIDKHGHGSWRALPKLAGLNRCGKSCRLRWTNYLRPDIKRGRFSPEEEQTILNLHSILGNKWSAIAGHLPGRTDNEIKNFWNTHLKKKLIQMGFDPMTHRPRTDIFSTLPHLLALVNLGEIMDRLPWEDHSVRLQQAEAVQMAKLQCLQYLHQIDQYSTAGMEHVSNIMTAVTSSSSTSNLGNMEPLRRPSNSQTELQFANFQEQEQLLQIPPSIINETDHDHQLLSTVVDNRGKNTTQAQQYSTPLMMVSSPDRSRVNLPPLTDASTGNITTGDACSTSSYDVCGTPNSLWNDLFLDGLPY